MIEVRFDLNCGALTSVSLTSFANFLGLRLLDSFCVPTFPF